MPDPSLGAGEYRATRRRCRICVRQACPGIRPTQGRRTAYSGTLVLDRVLLDRRRRCRSKVIARCAVIRESPVSSAIVA
jgi:hypothetical protein